MNLLKAVNAKIQSVEKVSTII